MWKRSGPERLWAFLCRWTCGVAIGPAYRISGVQATRVLTSVRGTPTPRHEPFQGFFPVPSWVALLGLRCRVQASFLECPTFVEPDPLPPFSEFAIWKAQPGFKLRIAPNMGSMPKYELHPEMSNCLNHKIEQFQINCYIPRFPVN